VIWNPAASPGFFARGRLPLPAQVSPIPPGTVPDSVPRGGSDLPSPGGSAFAPRPASSRSRRRRRAWARIRPVPFSASRAGSGTVSAAASRRPCPPWSPSSWPTRGLSGVVLCSTPRGIGKVITEQGTHNPAICRTAPISGAESRLLRHLVDLLAQFIMPRVCLTS